MARILLVTDAWHPQVNGVVRTLDTTTRTLRSYGHIVEVIEPTSYFQVPIPFYPEIRLAVPVPHRVGVRMRKFSPDHVHIATEGTLGVLARSFCLKWKWRYTTSYHTRFPEYVQQLVRFPESWMYGLLRKFHNRGSGIMVATPSLEAELKARGFTAPIRRWSRGVDQTQFRPQPHISSNYAKPIQLYVGRVSTEKGVEDFLKLNTSGTKLIVGDGPARSDLQRRYPQAVFLGYRTGQALSDCYAMADVFVFPSKTDTFGLVVVEALASGLPVAAYPATGPIDIITQPGLGAIHENLGTAVELALRTGNRETCLQEAARYTWDACTKQFESNLVPR